MLVTVDLNEKDKHQIKKGGNKGIISGICHKRGVCTHFIQVFCHQLSGQSRVPSEKPINMCVAKSVWKAPIFLPNVAVTSRGFLVFFQVTVDNSLIFLVSLVKGCMIIFLDIFYKFT